MVSARKGRQLSVVDVNRSRLVFFFPLFAASTTMPLFDLTELRQKIAVLSVPLRELDSD